MVSAAVTVTTTALHSACMASVSVWCEWKLFSIQVVLVAPFQNERGTTRTRIISHATKSGVFSYINKFIWFGLVCERKNVSALARTSTRTLSCLYVVRNEFLFGIWMLALMCIEKVKCTTCSCCTFIMLHDRQHFEKKEQPTRWNPFPELDSRNYICSSLE